MKALEHLRVLDLGAYLAGPFCGTLFAEFGAEVIKVEPVGGEDARGFGSRVTPDSTLVFLSENRNKKSITLNLKHPSGIDILRRLVAISDVVIENFRPGVMERMGLGYDEIAALNQQAVMVRISAFGQTGPYRGQVGFARIAHAFSGLAILSGEPGRVPVTPGSTSLADYTSGLFAAFGAMVALQARGRTGKGQCVDMALYESVFRMLDEMVPAYARFGTVRRAMGADTVNVCPHGHYRTRDARWVAIACSTDAMFARLAEAMGRPDLAAQDRFGAVAARLAAREEVNALVSEWTGSMNAQSLLETCIRGEVPAGLLYDVRDIFDDPHYAARGNIVEIPSPAGPLFLPQVVPRLSDTPGAIEHVAPAPGADNEGVLGGLLEIGADQLDQLRAGGVI